MSKDDDPFGRSDRTISRPNPGGRRPPLPGAPGYSAPPPAGGAPPASAPLPPVAYPPPHAAPGPQQPPAQQPPPPGAGQGAWDAWMNTPAAQTLYAAPGASQPMTPAPMSPHISVDVVTAAASPLMRAAASLLLLLGRLRASLARGGAGQLMDHVFQAIQQFESDARAGGAPPDQIETAKYALAATADDIVQNLPSEDSRVWTQYSMLVRFFNERMGGVRFFQELDRAKQNPAVNLGLLEVMHACLSLGFEGVYRAEGGPGALQGIRRDLYETIRRAQPKTIEDLSPHWRGQDIALAGSRFQVSTWSVAAAAGVILLATYLVLRNMLSGQAEALALTMAEVHPDTELSIKRETVVKPPPDPASRPSTQLQRIKAALAQEIIDKKVDADQSATTIFIRIGSLVLFPSGGAKVNDSFAPIAKKIAAALDREPGPIYVEGYTDSDPIRTFAYSSNFELSEARAKSVATMLKPGLSHPERLAVSGKGVDGPVVPNETEQSKSKKRRVEVSIPRAD
jgi:type VI secretion system protein ImpK